MLVMAGFDRQDQWIEVIDPADNLIAGIGVHDWSGRSSRLKTQVSGASLWITLDDKPALIQSAIIMRSGSVSDGVRTQSHRQAGLPDLSQHAAQGWDNLCAPTSAANLVFAAARRDERLRQYLRSRTSANRDGVATDIIAGSSIPPLLASSLASYMSTSLEGGTTGLAAASGLRQFLHEHGTADLWIVESIAAADHPSPESWLQKLCDFCGQEAGIILAVTWGLPQAPSSAVVDRSTPQSTAATSDNRPGNAPHAFNISAPEVSTPNDSQPSSSQSPGKMHTPAEPGEASINSGGNERRTSAAVEIPDLPPAVVLPALPEKPKHSPQPQHGRLDPKLEGKWRQVSGGNGPDFAEGGYREATLRITIDGVVTATRLFGDGQTLRIHRRLILEQTDAGKVQLTSADSDNGPPMLSESLSLRAPDGSEITIVPPIGSIVTVPVQIDGPSMKLGDKSYVRF
jgi:hypothetical protein